MIMKNALVVRPEHFSLTVFGKVGADAIDVEVNKGLLAFFAEEEGAVGGVVIIESF